MPKAHKGKQRGDQASNIMPRETHPDFNSLGGRGAGRARNTEGHFLGVVTATSKCRYPKVSLTGMHRIGTPLCSLTLHCAAPSRGAGAAGKPTAAPNGLLECQR